MRMGSRPDPHGHDCADTTEDEREAKHPGITVFISHPHNNTADSMGTGQAIWAVPASEDGEEMPQCREY